MALSQDSIKSLDQLRLRLSQLSISLASLRADLDRSGSDRLPTWPALQSTAAALSFNLQQTLETFNAHRLFLQSAHAYPLATFPGRTQEGLLEQLLRKKLEPGVEDWIADFTTTKDVVGFAEYRELWDFAAPTARQMREGMEEDGLFEDDFTIAEREGGLQNVVTGLRRRLDDGDSGEDDDEDNMEDVMPTTKPPDEEKQLGIDPRLPPQPLEAMLRFTSTGALPPGSRL